MSPVIQRLIEPTGFARPMAAPARRDSRSLVGRTAAPALAHGFLPGVRRPPRTGGGANRRAPPQQQSLDQVMTHYTWGRTPDHGWITQRQQGQHHRARTFVRQVARVRP